MSELPQSLFGEPASDNRLELLSQELKETLTVITLKSITRSIRILKDLTISGSEQLDLFEQMIDALLDNKFIVTGIRMKQERED